MDTTGRHRLEQVGKVITFLLAVAIMALQAWGAFQGREVNSLLIGFAVCILAPATFQLLFPGRGGSEPSPVLPPVSSSPGPQPSSSGGSSSEQI